APIPVLVDRAALARDDSLESSEELCSLLAEIGAKHDQCFVWTHSDSFLVRTCGFVSLRCCRSLLSVGCSAAASLPSDLRALALSLVFALSRSVEGLHCMRDAVGEDLFDGVRGRRDSLLCKLLLVVAEPRE